MQIFGLGGGSLFFGGVVIIVVSTAAFGNWTLVKLDAGENLKLELQKQKDQISLLEQQIAKLENNDALTTRIDTLTRSYQTLLENLDSTTKAALLSVKWANALGFNEFGNEWNPQTLNDIQVPKEFVVNSIEELKANNYYNAFER